MFTAVLFTIAEIWKQPKCPLIDEWVKKMWYMYTMEYYSAIKEMKSYILPQCGCTIMTYAKGNKSEKDKYYMVSFIHEIF